MPPGHRLFELVAVRVGVEAKRVPVGTQLGLHRGNHLRPRGDALEVGPQRRRRSVTQATAGVGTSPRTHVSMRSPNSANHRISGLEPMLPVMLQVTPVKVKPVEPVW